MSPHQTDSFSDSCSGRGSRAAAWFADHIKEKNDTEMQSLKLDGGIKAWVKGGEEYTAQMVGFDQGYWTTLG